MKRSLTKSKEEFREETKGGKFRSNWSHKKKKAHSVLEITQKIKKK